MPPRRRASPVSKDERETNRELLALEAAVLLALLRAVKKRDRREVERVLVDSDRRARLLARERVAAELRFPASNKPPPMVTKTVTIVRRVDMGDGTFREIVSTHSSTFPKLPQREQTRLRKLSSKMVTDANARDRAAAGSASPREAKAAAKAATESQARLVATTETMNSFSLERERTAQQIARATDAPVEKEWRATLDIRACERCASLNGERTSVFAEFSFGEPPLHPRCRCWVYYHVSGIGRAALDAYWLNLSQQ
jgi:hypothetical protein